MNTLALTYLLYICIYYLEEYVQPKVLIHTVPGYIKGHVLTLYMIRNMIVS